MLEDIGAAGADLQGMCLSFQGAHHLPPSGNADAATVTLAASLIHSKSIASNQASGAKGPSPLWMIWLPAGFFALMLILAITMKIFVIKKKNEIVALAIQLDELRTGEVP